MDVARLIEPGAKFDNGGDLFARIGRIDERLDYRRVAARSIKRDLEREHLRILGRFFDQLDYLIEAVIRMMEQHILPA